MAKRELILSRSISVYKKSYIYFVFAFWYVTELIFNTSAQTIMSIDKGVLNNAVNYLMLVLLMIQIVFFQTYDIKSFGIIALISCIMMISVIISGNNSILATWMFVVGSKDINMDRVIRIARNILLVMIPGIILFWHWGYLEDAILYRNGIIRHSLGFIHCNQLGMRVFQLVLCFVFLNRKNIRVFQFVIIVCAAIFCYIVPRSQTATVALIVLFVLMLLYSFRNHFKTSLFANIMIVSAILVNSLSVALSIIDWSNNRLFSVINGALSNRFSTCYRVYHMFGVRLWGNRIYVTEKERVLAGIVSRLWLDNAYMFMLLRYGIITFLIFSVMYILGMLYYKQSNDNMMVIILFLYAVYGVMETGMFMMQHNVFLLALGVPLYYRSYLRESLSGVFKERRDCVL